LEGENNPEAIIGNMDVTVTNDIPHKPKLHPTENKFKKAQQTLLNIKRKQTKTKHRGPTRDITTIKMLLKHGTEDILNVPKAQRVNIAKK